MYLFFLEGLLNFKPENRRRKRGNQERRPVFLPHLTPPSSAFNSTPPPRNTPLSNSEGQQGRGNSDGASLSNTRPPVDDHTDVQTKEPQPDEASLTESMKLRRDPAGPACSPSPPSMLSNASLSGFSGPPSAVFTQSTELSGWISGQSGNGCQQSASRWRDHRPSSGGRGLTHPFCRHHSRTIWNDLSSFITQQMAGTRTQDAALPRRSSRVC